jgi:hypothetical protein
MYSLSIRRWRLVDRRMLLCCLLLSSGRTQRIFDLEQNSPALSRNFTLVSESESSPQRLIAAVKIPPGIDGCIKPRCEAIDGGGCA